MRRALPALSLSLLAPLVAEFLLGNLPITALYTLVLLAPLYGGGALLIREAVRHAGRGWPSILILALGYGVLEEGVGTMSLFNPNYVGLRLLDNGYVPWLGIGVPWTVLVLTLHVVWSISVPIAMIETLVPARRTTPWLGRIGLAVTGCLFLVGMVGVTAFSIAQSGFVATPAQLITSGAIAVGLAVVGLMPVPSLAPRDRATTARVPRPWLVGILAFAASSAFKLLPLDWPPVLYVSLALGLALISLVVVSAWSRRSTWGGGHRLALAAGPLLTYAWSAFPQPPVMPASPTEDLIGNATFALAAIILIGGAANRLRRAPNDGPATARATHAASRAA